MEQTVSFPGLGIGPLVIRRDAFSIFGLPVYWYGVIIAAAFLLAIGYILRRARLFGVDPDRALDVILGGVAGGIIGARIYYVVFSWEQYRDNLAAVFNLREGGIAIYGGVIGGFLVGALMCRLRGVKFIPMADLAVGGLILGQAIGRWGNFVNVEAFGGVTGAPWRMCSPSAADYLLRQGIVDSQTAQQILDGTLGVHPTFFYESAWCLMGFVLIALLSKRRRFDGEMVLLYAAWYGAERGVVEGLRTDSLMWGGVRVSQALAIVLTVASIAFWLYLRAKIRKSGDPDYLKRYVDTAEGQSVLDGAFYQKGEEAPRDAGAPGRAGGEPPAPEREVQTSENMTEVEDESNESKAD